MAEIRPIRVTAKGGDTYFIRTALVKDAERILRCACEVIGERIYSVTSPVEFSMISVEQEMDMIEEYRKDPKKLFLIIENEKREVVGDLTFSCGRKLREGHIGEFGMGILASCRGKGLGEKLLQALLDWATSVPALEKINLTVHSNNHRAQALYRKLGFEVEGVMKRNTRFETGEYVDSILMAKFLR